MASELRAVAQRRKSPRAPSISLEDALGRAQAIYAKEQRHPAPVDVVAQYIGYKNANSGAALSTLASLRYYGLVDRPQDGILQVVKDVEDYASAPSADRRRDLLQTWVRTPAVFADLLDKFPQGLPSERDLLHELIQRGFNPVAAQATLKAFLRSVEFAGIFEPGKASPLITDSPSAVSTLGSGNDSVKDSLAHPSSRAEGRREAASLEVATSSHDRIPVRLSGGRRAWLEIPALFYEADKLRLKAQLDLLLTEDQDNDGA